MTTPAQELRAAAEKLRALAAAATESSGSDQWEALRRYPGDPDHTSTILRAAPGKNLIHGGRAGKLPGPAVSGPVGDYIAAMGPNVGTLIADWLEQAADAFEGQAIPNDEPALAAARVLLGGQP